MTMLFRRRGVHIEEEQLSAFLDGALDAGPTNEIAEHLRSCEACASILEALGAAKALVAELPQVRPARSFVLGPEFARREAPAPTRSPFVFAPAAALTLFLALIAVDLRGVATDEFTAGLEVGDDAKTMASSPAQRSAQPPAAVGGAAQEMSPPVPAPSVAVGEVRPFSAPAEGAVERQSADAANDAIAPGVPPSTPAVAGEGTSSDDPAWLRPLQAGALGAFVVSLIAVAWPRLRRRGESKR
jgi:hypothetical protein